MTRYSTLCCEKLESIARRKSDPKRIEKNLCRFGRCPPDWNQTGVRTSGVEFCLDIAVLRHLEFDLGSCDVGDFVAEGAKIAVDYFTGEYLTWDDKSKHRMRKEADNQSLSWFDTYRQGLLLAFMADDEASERSLVSWVEPWLPFDEAPSEVTPHDNTYHKLLAEYLSAGTRQSNELVSEMEVCKKKPPKLLYDGLTAICGGDDKQLSKSVSDYLHNFLKKEFSKGGIGSYSCLEASIQNHVARRAGLEITGLDEKQQALIMTRETLGLA